MSESSPMEGLALVVGGLVFAGLGWGVMNQFLGVSPDFHSGGAIFLVGAALMAGVAWSLKRSLRRLGDD